jgi:hypothetical protein
MPTQNEINEYKYAIAVNYAKFVNTYTNDVKRSGRNQLKYRELKFILVQAYLDIMFDYLDRALDADDTNFFDVEEINDIMQHINNILSINYWLDFN